MGRKVQAVMRRGPGGSSYMQCEVCDSNIPAALADMHKCKDEAAFREALVRMKEEYAKRLEECRAADEAANAEKKQFGKKKGKDGKVETGAQGAKAKDPKGPKRPPTSYLLFLEDFREEYKKEHPDKKTLPEMAKAGGEKWKSLTDEEKKVYTDKAADRKKEYEEALKNPQGDETEEPADEANILPEDGDRAGSGSSQAPDEDDTAKAATQGEDAGTDAKEKGNYMPNWEETASGHAEGTEEPEKKRRRLIKCKTEEEVDTKDLEDELQDATD